MQNICEYVMHAIYQEANLLVKTNICVYDKIWTYNVSNYCNKKAYCDNNKLIYE